MAKKFVVQEDEPVKSRFTASVQMSGKIEYVKPSDLKPNPLNTTLFSTNNADLDKLRADIQERGILVPLIVKRDKTVLAGHTRLNIALELGLLSVPVQFVDSGLQSEEEERKFVINDNLLRRQLSNEERMNLYRVLYPTLDTLLADDKSNGRPKKGELTIKQIAEETGQQTNTVKKQFQRAREEKRYSVPLLQNKAPKSKKRDTVPLLQEKTKNNKTQTAQFHKREAEQALETLRMVYPSLPEKDKKEILRSLGKLTKTLKEENYLVIV